MSRARPPRASGTPARRRGLVLGAGGVLGAAWTVGALVALQDTEGFDVRDVEVLVGTSAGSVLASLLGAGVTPAELRQDLLGIEVATGPVSYTHLTLPTIYSV